MRYSFSRSYGVNLPSSLTRVISRLRILSSSTCVGFGYGFLTYSLEAFLGSLGSLHFMTLRSRHHLSELYGLGDLPPNPSYRFAPALPTAGWRYLSASPHHSNASKEVLEY